jgi:hypothetical protein
MDAQATADTAAIFEPSLEFAIRDAVDGLKC